MAFSRTTVLTSVPLPTYQCVTAAPFVGRREDPRFSLSKLFFLSMIAKCHLLRANRVVVVVSPVFPLITVSSSCPALYRSGLFRLFLPQNIVVGNGEVEKGTREEKCLRRMYIAQCPFFVPFLPSCRSTAVLTVHVVLHAFLDAKKNNVEEITQLLLCRKITSLTIREKQNVRA